MASGRAQVEYGMLPSYALESLPLLAALLLPHEYVK